MLKSREICVGLWTGATAMMKEKYDDAMVCTNIYKYICIYTNTYKKSCFQPRELFCWCHIVCFIYIFLKGKLYVVVFLSESCRIGFFEVLGQIYTLE